MEQAVRLITIDELSNLLRVKKSTIYAWVNQRKIPYKKIGRLVRFQHSEILKWVQERGIPAIELC